MLGPLSRFVIDGVVFDGGAADHVAGPEPGEFPAVAETVVADSFVVNAPPGLTTDDVVAVLRAAY